MEVKRGDIYLADLSPVIGSEQGGERPVIVVQNNIGNKYSPTIIVIAVSSRCYKKELAYSLQGLFRSYRKERSFAFCYAEWHSNKAYAW